MKTTDARRDRRIDLDLLRSAAIILIVATHLNGYTSVIRTPAEHFVGELGRSLFVFLSGYALAVAYLHLGSLAEMRRFLGRRISKIYPLYIPAILIYVALFHYGGIYHQWNIRPLFPTILAHATSTQILLSPWVTPMETLWFIGCIIPYYFLYVALARYGGTVKRMVVVGLLVFAAFAGLKILTGLVEYRFFYYYPVFMGGVLVGRVQRPVESGTSRYAVAGILVGLLIMAAAMVFLWSVRGQIHDLEDRAGREFLVAEGVCFLFSTAGIWVAMRLSKMVGSLLSREWAARVTYLSVASYALYLFHRPLLALLTWFLQQGLGWSGYPSDLGVICVGLPLTLFLSYHLQRLSDMVMKPSTTIAVGGRV